MSAVAQKTDLNDFQAYFAHEVMATFYIVYMWKIIRDQSRSRTNYYISKNLINDIFLIFLVIFLNEN